MPYQTYDLRTYYKKQPGNPTSCLRCDGKLSTTRMERSIAMREALANEPGFDYPEYMYLWVCRRCGWWCFRENWAYYIDRWVLDYITAEVRTSESAEESLLASDPAKPWLAALQNKDLYAGTLPFPEEFARILPAGVSDPEPEKIPVPIPMAPLPAAIEEKVTFDGVDPNTMDDPDAPMLTQAQFNLVCYVVWAGIVFFALFSPVVIPMWQGFITLPVSGVQGIGVFSSLLLVGWGVVQLKKEGSR